MKGQNRSAHQKTGVIKKLGVVLLLTGFGSACLAQGEKPMTSLTVAFSQPARCVPTDMMVDGPLLGNGDMGVVVAGPPEQLRFRQRSGQRSRQRWENDNDC